MKKIALIFALAAWPAFGQDQAAAARTAAGCGPDQMNFDVRADKKQHPAPTPEAGRAMVYVFEELKTNDDLEFGIGGVITKVGVDGNWVGGNKSGAYFFFPVEPGEHRVCVAWQSSYENLAKKASAASFSAKPGDVLYFRAKVRAFSERDQEREHRLGVGRNEYDLKLEPVDPAEAQILIANLALAKSRPKK